MAAAHRFATGESLSLTTTKIRTVLLLYFKIRGSGMTCPVAGNTFFSVKGVSWCAFVKLWDCYTQVLNQSLLLQLWNTRQQRVQQVHRITSQHMWQLHQTIPPVVQTLLQVLRVTQQPSVSQQRPWPQSLWQVPPPPRLTTQPQKHWLQQRRRRWRPQLSRQRAVPVWIQVTIKTDIRPSLCVHFAQILTKNHFSLFFPLSLCRPPQGNLILIQENMTWIQAMTYCREHYVDLVHISTQDVQERVAEMAKNATSPQVWIGLRYTCNFNFWFWASSASGCYLNWAPGQGSDRIYDCGATGAVEATGRQQWVGLPETEKLNFICTACAGWVQRGRRHFTSERVWKCVLHMLGLFLCAFNSIPCRQWH